MKKFFMSAFALVVASCFFFSCADLNVESNSSAESIRKQELALLAATGGYVLSEDVMKDSLLSFLTASDTESRSVISANSYEFTLADETTVSYPEVRLERSIAPESINSLSLYLYEFSNKDNESSGFAITSTDERIGSVLAVVPEGNLEDGENDFLAFYTECLENYIEETVDLWNEIDDEYIRAVCKEARVTVNSERSIGEPQKKLYEYTELTYNSGNSTKLIGTNWGQQYDYNDAIEAVYKKNYLVGCSSVAVAQLLAYYKPNMTMHPTCFSNLKSKWSDIGTWSGVYDWNEITKSSTIYGLSKSAKLQLQALLYEIPERFGAKYGTTETEAKNARVAQVFSSLGFSNSGTESYKFDRVKSAIDNYGPLAMYGSAQKKTKSVNIFGKKITVSTSYYYGHVWVVDGYANFTCNVKNSTTEENVIKTDNFIHCNAGWYGNNNGYYKSGVFDMNNTPLPDDRSEYKKYYQYNLHIIRNLKFTGIYEPVSFGVAATNDDEDE